MKTVTSSLTPLQPSFLRYSSEPASPACPLSPSASRPACSMDLPTYRQTASSCAPPSTPPGQPLPWLWRCHLCRNVYSLSVTRRCLTDGHYFCSGIATTKRGNKHVQRCSSEFDYLKWAEWRDWRQEMVNSGSERAYPHKDCSLDCAYPSDCRWKKIMMRKEAQEHVAGDNVVQATQGAQHLDHNDDLPVEHVAIDVATVAPIESENFLHQPQFVGQELIAAHDLISPLSPLKQHYQLKQFGGDTKTIGIPSNTLSNDITASLLG